MVRRTEKPIRYGVVGLGHIAQAAVLPAFANAENSELGALVSGDDEKLEKLGERYEIEAQYHYDDFDAMLTDEVVDAVYIAVPNHLHHDYVLRAARAGVHVLCEKPLAVTSQQCQEMVEACEEHDVLLMTAYRLHFEAANLRTIDAARNGDFGDLRFFQASFSQNVTDGDIRLMPIEEGGGTVYDMGTYCINAARYLFGDEPYEVMALSESKAGDDRFSDCDEMTGALLRFPGERLALFLTSFGSYATSAYRLVGTNGEAVLEPAFEYATNLKYEFRVGDETQQETLEKRDQFGPELIYFSDCIEQGRRPEPDGYEGWADVQIIEAIYESARSAAPVAVDVVASPKRPTVDQIITRPGFDKPEEIKASSPKE